jgi:hypothetical protein
MVAYAAFRSVEGGSGALFFRIAKSALFTVMWELAINFA